MSQELEALQKLSGEQRSKFLASLPNDRKENVLAELEQRKIADKYLNDPVGYIQDVLKENIWSEQKAICEAVRDHKRTVVPACHAPGKACPLDTPIPTPSGWKQMGDLMVGDSVYSELGRPVAVVGITPVHIQPCYRVVFDDDTHLDVAGPHEWSVLLASARHAARVRTNYRDEKPIRDWRNHWDLSEVVTTEFMVATGLSTKGDGRRYAIPTTQPLEGSEWTFPIPPYTLGLWLGDGDSSGAGITMSHEDAIFSGKQVEKDGYVVRERPSGHTDTTGRWGVLGSLWSSLRSTGLWNNKHIPAECLRSSFPSRLALLQGLVDSDGYQAETESYEICLTNKRLAQGVRELVTSLGWKASWREGIAKLNGVDYGPKYTVSFWPDVIAARLPRKLPQGESSQQSRSTIRMVVDIIPLGNKEVKCIEVDNSSHLFLAGEGMVPTRNSHLAARLIAWWIAVHPLGTALAITTATTFRQVKNILWPHIRRLHERHNLPGRTNLTEWYIGTELVAWGFSASDEDPEAVQGHHAPHMMVLVDEAAGISFALGGAFESLMTGPSTRMLLLGNPPTDKEGTWFEHCCNSDIDTKDDGKYKVIQLSADKTPNWTEEDTGPCLSCPPGVKPHKVAEHLVDKQWAQDIADEWGAESPMFVAKVLAQFPKGVSTKTIPSVWIESALENTGSSEGTAITLGVDVASDGGDEVVIAQAVGTEVEIVYNNAGQANANAVDVAGKILEFIRTAESLNQQLDNIDPVKVNIDSVGLGWGVVSTLERWGQEGVHGAIICGVDAGEKAENPDKFMNRRAEIWWNGRLLLAPRKDDHGNQIPSPIHLKMDRKSAAQLSYPNYRTETSGKIRIERKVEMKARGLHSPDRAEAVLLALYKPDMKKRRKARLIV